MPWSVGVWEEGVSPSIVVNTKKKKSWKHQYLESNTFYELKLVQKTPTKIGTFRVEIEGRENLNNC